MEKVSAGRKETLVGAVILLVLVGIAGGVFIRQAAYDPEVFRAASVEPAVSSVASPSAPATAESDEAVAELRSYLPDTLTALTPPETFVAQNLSDKIDGKAELYLSAGFVRMHCQRFALVGNAASWVEVFVYDMGHPRNAFAVFSTQRRTDAEALTLTRFAYRTANSLFFVHGSDYVEMVAAVATDDMAQAMLAFGEAFVSGKPAAAHTAAEGHGFPPEQLDEASITLLAADAFGFDRFNHIYVARYHTEAGPITAFLSERASAEEAGELAASYQKFLLVQGAMERTLSAAIPEGKLLQVFDTFEVVFSKGRMLAGVHDAPSEVAAQKVALKLYQELAEGGL